ncbi:P-loop NTPase family protein [Hyphomonas atlantica corrig.]|uniref:hypothetical protein n=1 Tax=Hyphomonas atlantica TaxID=1280948 RepID=UPI002355C230|nr:hypothetical protein [Hyphomonas atlantica]
MEVDLPPGTPLRLVVIGISGAGKTTFATRVAKALAIPQIELDLLNWRPGWHDRYVHEFEAFKADVVQAIASENWVLAGGYSRVRPMIFERANIVVWLDMPKSIVFGQVFLRSLKRTTDRKPILNGNHESFLRWFNKGHPIQIVWNNYQRKREKYEAQLSGPEAAHLKLIQCRTRKDVEAAFAAVIQQKIDRPRQI